MQEQKIVINEIKNVEIDWEIAMALRKIQKEIAISLFVKVFSVTEDE